MPRYDYRCTACDYFYEKQEGFDAPSSQECPRCGNRARRVFTPPPIIFKGSGFYVTDSKKQSGSVTVGSPPVDTGATPDGGKRNGAAEPTSPTSTPAARADDAPAAPAGAASD